MNYPKPFEPVLAYIFYANSLGTLHWYEVVYYSGEGWNCFWGSNTFQDGEIVLKWRYAKDCFDEL